MHENVDKSARTGRSAVTALDMDIMANKLHELDRVQLDFVLNLFYKFRHTKASIRALESMSHALIRTLLEWGEIERLMVILRDKVHYGIFLDDYTANLLMDFFIERNMLQEAGQVASDMMLQESLEHPITRYLAWLASQSRLSQLSIPDLDDLIDPLPDDDEVKYRRIKFIQEPWYDDHFDLPTEHHMLGKTLTMVAQVEEMARGGEGDMLTRGAHLVGCGYHRKFDKGLKLMRQWVGAVDVKDAVAESQVELFGSLLDAVKTREELPEKEAGLQTIRDKYPFITAAQKQQYLNTYQELLTQLKSAGKIVKSVDVNALLRERVAKVIAVTETHDKAALSRLYETWSHDRESLLQEQIRHIETERRKKELAERLLKLKLQEEKLRYFDEQSRIELKIVENPPIENPMDKVVEEEQFVAPPTERPKSGADTMKKKSK